jgi:hypothetical protein
MWYKSKTHVGLAQERSDHDGASAFMLYRKARSTSPEPGQHHHAPASVPDSTIPLNDMSAAFRGQLPMEWYFLARPELMRHGGSAGCVHGISSGHSRALEH